MKTIKEINNEFVDFASKYVDMKTNKIEKKYPVYIKGKDFNSYIQEFDNGDFQLVGDEVIIIGYIAKELANLMDRVGKLEELLNKGL